MTSTKVAGLHRDELLADRGLVGTVLCRALSRRVDEWLQAVFEAEVGEHENVSLVAVGGYGRSELCPQSDIDLLLLHRDRSAIEEIAKRLWYPIWDEGLRLGHAVRTPRECRDLARTDLDTATSLLDARHIAGDAELSDDLISDSANQWRRQARKWLPELADRVERRHQSHGEVAFDVEPDLKSGRGGLRDVHVMHWAAAAWVEFSGQTIDEAVRDAYEVLLAARVELHRVTRHRGDKLLMQEQAAVAANLARSDDELMADIASAARSIAWHSDETWALMQDSGELLGGLRRRLRSMGGRDDEDLDVPGVFAREGRAVLAEDVDASDPLSALRLARAASAHGLRMDRDSLHRLHEDMKPLGDPWPTEARELFIELLLCGDAAIGIIEALDQCELFVRILPEWAPNRNRPQRNVYHKYTVDRHLCEAAAQASQLTERVDRPDLLVLAALLHDIGKGYAGDHTEQGMRLVRDIADRMSYPPTDVDVLVALVEHHLLLPDVATRRDLEDPETIAEVVRKVRTLDRLRLLAALTEADSIATGSKAWSKNKATLVRQLVTRCSHVMQGGDIGEITSSFPPQEYREMMRAGETLVTGDGDTLLLVAPDQLGMFSQVTGVLAMSGLRVLQAVAHSEYDMALERFQVENILDLPIDWALVTSRVTQALAGRLAVEARLAMRIDQYASGAAPSGYMPQPVVEPKLTLDNESSSSATIVEVAAQASLEMLSRVSGALSQLKLDIASAKVQDLGGDVVYAFYVRDALGEKITDPDHLAEIRLAVSHAVASAGSLL